MAKTRVVLYLNQFFAGIGGEDKADVGFGVSGKPPSALVICIKSACMMSMVMMPN